MLSGQIRNGVAAPGRGRRDLVRPARQLPHRGGLSLPLLLPRARAGVARSSPTPGRWQPRRTAPRTSAGERTLAPLPRPRASAGAAQELAVASSPSLAPAPDLDPARAAGHGSGEQAMRRREERGRERVNGRRERGGEERERRDRMGVSEKMPRGGVYAKPATLFDFFFFVLK